MSRTNIDWSKHELYINKSEGLLIHHLKKPDTICHNVKFINTNNILAVTGDYGNWIFCREFHPSKDGFVSDFYWLEKLEIYSYQKGEDYSSEKTIETLNNGINYELEEYGYEGKQLIEAKEYYKDCLRYADCEWEYVTFAYNEIPYFMDAEDVPFEKIIKPRLQIVFDAFDEICNRMKDENNETSVKEL